MESVTLFRLVMACLGGLSLAASLYQWFGERQQAFVSGACGVSEGRRGIRLSAAPDHAES